ncbi:MAG: AAA family ATPase [Nitrospirota bacterium]|nr:AAA family ATPase [Nitrospirota bacterium]
MKVINLYGGAGAGKSTLASALFSRLRFDNQVSVELVPEFAKDVVYEGARRNLGDQFYLLGNQQHRLWRLMKEGVDVAITDSPIGMTIAYAHMGNFPHIEELITIVNHLNRQYTNLNVFVNRPGPGNFRKNKQRNADIDMWIKEDVPMHLNVDFNQQGVDDLYQLTIQWLAKNTKL